MPPPSAPSLDGRLYRAALSLCPATFRHDHGEEMARDFDDACEEAADRYRDLWVVRACMAIDLARTLAVQWSRTRLPVIAAASIALSLAMAEALAFLARRASLRMLDRIQGDETVVVLVIAEVSVLLIAMTLVVSLWTGRMMRRRRR